VGARLAGARRQTARALLVSFVVASLLLDVMEYEIDEARRRARRHVAGAEDSALQNGDYLLLHKPTETRFSRREGVVRGGRWEIGVEEVAVGRAVALLRVTGPVTRQTGP
jgi:hypothetical protein